ncbi:hypothetical protein HDU85_000554 [Gaertneriomyces sp. JEL0708]|nr:hypothetical protein HDU85_000554 [Gaertneriomyces sp. JEL0708]
MDSLIWLLFLSFSMFGGSFMAGNVPLMLSFTDDRLRLVSTFGSGMLVGTALTVIIPEGVETLYSLQLKEEVAEAIAALKEKEDSNVNSTRGEAEVETQPPDTPRRGRRALTTTIVPVRGQVWHQPAEARTTPEFSATQNAHTDHAFAAHSYIGSALTLGFAMMFLIEHAGGHFGHGHKSPSHIAVNDFRELNSAHNGNKLATIGLVVHAAADGIALGAASVSDRASLGLIVFLAIMLHKAPSAFALSTVLLGEGHALKTIRKHLLIFSLAAPVAAITTCLALYTYGIDDPSEMHKWTGILLLFSAGTFLYVATVHVLPEIYGSGGKKQSDKKLTVGQMACLLVGMFMPGLLAIKHEH